MGRGLSPRILAAVALGGAVGAVLRWAAGAAFPAAAAGFPWATLLVNVVGCFALGALVSHPTVARSAWLPLLGPGLCGGFTTMSAYAEETRALLADGHAAAGAAYVVGTLAACLVAVSLGRAVGGRR